MVAHSEIIKGAKSIGYIVYTGFETSSDEALLAALQQFDEAGVDEVILDLRTNSGGSITSAQKLASALLPAWYEGMMLCEVRRNPKNKMSDGRQEFPIVSSDTHLDIDHLTIITSNFSASASELVIVGLRGLDIPVTVVGATTNGKNCGMDVTRRQMGSVYLEYAPITFMCFNAKGEGDWGDGIQPDVDVEALDDSYPMPYAP
jgi:C-terminal processing protease CtpA/Prc